MEPTKRVIFLCLGNSIRSPMAEAFMKKHAGDRFEIHSAGIYPKGIHPLAIKVMHEAGIDIRAQDSKSLREFLKNGKFDYVFTVCTASAAQCPSRFLNQGIHIKWDFENPDEFPGSEEEKLERFRRVRDQIEAQIKAWLAANPA